jgi:hypothetical protein
MRQHPSGRPIRKTRTVAAPQPRAPKVGLIPHLKRKPKPKRDQSGRQLEPCIGFIHEFPSSEWDGDDEWD